MANNSTFLCDSGKIYQGTEERSTPVTDDVTGVCTIWRDWDHKTDPSPFWATGRGSWMIRSVDNGVTWEKLNLILTTP